MLGALAFLYTLIGGSALAISAASDKARKNSVDRAIQATKDRREEMARKVKAVSIDDPYGSERYVKAVAGIREDMVYLFGEEVVSEFEKDPNHFRTKEYPNATLSDIEGSILGSRFCLYVPYGVSGFYNLRSIRFDEGDSRRIYARAAALMERNYRNFGIYMDLRFIMTKDYSGEICYSAVPVCELGAPVGMSVLDHPINADIKQLVIQDGNYRG